ncbi:hypothetical protein GW17_00006622 [Ensete ventricosum]|nr:hypothetical protein GW17_00006622 [Ensete ventricosum]
MTRLEATAAADEAAIEEEVVAVFLLAGDADNKEGQQVPVSNGSGEEEEVRAAGWLQGRCDYGRGKKMRRARLEVTAAAREDGCSLRLHDEEEEWATLRTDCGKGKQRSRGRRRFLPLLRGGRAAVARPIAGNRTVGGKRPEQQGRMGGLR